MAFSMTQICEEIDKWTEESNSVKIFVTGKTGTGKSTLVNGIVGQEVARVGRCLEPGTSDINPKKCSTGPHNVAVTVCDSPGLQDGNTEEASYLDMIRQYCTTTSSPAVYDVDLILYCMNMSDTRMKGYDVNAMIKLTKTLGKDMWKNTLIVLTFANRVVTQAEEEHDNNDVAVSDAYATKLKMWIDEIRSVLFKDVNLSKEEAQKIRITPAGKSNKPQIIPGDDVWLSKLWYEAVSAARSSAVPALIKMNEHRFKVMSEVDQSHLSRQLQSEQPIIFAEKGLEIGHELGIPLEGLFVGFVKGFCASLKEKLLFAVWCARHGITIATLKEGSSDDSNESQDRTPIDPQ